MSARIVTVDTDDLTLPAAVKVPAARIPDLPARLDDLGVVRSGSLLKVEAMTRSEYDLIDPHDPSTLYVITEGA